MKASIGDVALKAGVSNATVSRTFAHPEQVSEATRLKVQAAACTRVKSLRVIPHANRSICVMYGRFCFSYGNISLIYGTSPAKTATSGVRF